MEPGFQAQYVFQVPGGGKLPDDKNIVEIYPCFSFQVHIPNVEIDPENYYPTVPPTVPPKVTCLWSGVCYTNSK